MAGAWPSYAGSTASPNWQSSALSRVVTPDRTIDVVIRWDHRITDAALIAKAMTRLEQVLNTEISAELRSLSQATGPMSVRTVAN